MRTHQAKKGQKIGQGAALAEGTAQTEAGRDEHHADRLGALKLGVAGVGRQDDSARATSGLCVSTGTRGKAEEEVKASRPKGTCKV